MVYRSDIDALEARHAALAAEVAERARDRDEVGRLLADARARDDAARELVERPARLRRRRMRALVAAAIAGVALTAGAVGYRLSHPPRDRMAEVVAKFEGFTNQACACETSKCAQGVLDTMTQWGTEMAKDAKDAPRPDEATTKHFVDLGQRMSDCIARAMSYKPGQ